MEKEGEESATSIRAPHEVSDGVDQVEGEEGNAEVDERDAQSRGTNSPEKVLEDLLE